MKLLNVYIIINLFCFTSIQAGTKVNSVVDNSILKDSTLTRKLPGFIVSPYFDEQVCAFNYEPEIRIFIDAPSIKRFDPHKPTEIILFALPNGNTIEQTIGKKLKPGDDWHFDIQHIGAQTRFLRDLIDQKNIIVVYLETSQKSWPMWKKAHSDYHQIINTLFDYLIDLFKKYNPSVILTGHSGGGSFTFGLLDGFEKIPNIIKRITFLDSDYGYTNSYGQKILEWVKASSDNHLCVIAYDDSKVLFNGKPIVSDTGGTWFRSNLMKSYFDNYVDITKEENKEFIQYSGLNSQIQIILKKNPEKLILHTKQVELNGFIQGMVSGSVLESKNYKYYGDRAYSQYIQDGNWFPKIMETPPK
jgi:hypothetical protein